MADEAPQAEGPPAPPPATQDQALPDEVVTPPTQDHALPDEVVTPPTQDQALPDEVVTPPTQRRARGGGGGPSQSRAVLRQRLLIGVAFVAPSLVIAASVALIVRGGEGRASSLGAISARPSPSSAPTLFPGELDEHSDELSEPSADAGHSLEQPNQVIAGVPAAEGAASG